MGNEVLVSLSPSPPAAPLPGAAVAAERGESRTRSSGFGPVPLSWRELTHRDGGAQGEACGSRGGLFTAPETRVLLFQGCLSVWECGPCPAPGAGAPWGAGLAEAPC